MKPYKHACNSARKHGGIAEDYQEIHDFFDSSKSCIADPRHRSILHSTFGIFLLERVFGTTVVNSEGKHVSVRDLGEAHVFEDLGFIPTLDRWFRNMPVESWMSGQRRKRVTSKFETFKENADEQANTTDHTTD